MGSKKMLSAYMTSIMVASMFYGIGMGGAEASNGDFGGGDGTSGNPYIIEDVRDLQNMSGNLGAHYALKNDINASATVNWNSGAGFNPVGTSGSGFYGSLDGRNHTISGLFINRNSTSGVGLLGFSSGAVKNVGLVGINITGYDYVGGLVGFNSGPINKSYAVGNVTGYSYYTGGLLGLNVLTAVNNSYAMGNVTGTLYVGGLVGINDRAAVNNSHAVTVVKGTSFYVGGLLGRNDHGSVDNSYVTGNVTGYHFVGGLVGTNNGPVNNSHASGNVIGHDDSGGLLGYNLGAVNLSFATGNVTGAGSIFGGLVGNNQGKVNNSYAIVNVTGNNSLVGGLVGNGDPPAVSNSYYNINYTFIDGEHRITLGGLFDEQFRDWLSSNLSLDISDYSASIVPSGGYYNIGGVGGLRDLLGFAGVAGYRFRLTADMNLSGSPGLYIPYLQGEVDGDNHTLSNLLVNVSAYGVGMIGYNRAGTVKSIKLVNANVTGHSAVGGLLGFSSGTVNNSCVTGNVKGTYVDIGGLVGRNTGMLNNSSAAADVTGYSYVGGLAGYNYCGTVSCSWAAGNVSGAFDSVGGLLGTHSGNGMAYKSYATGNVTGKRNYVGGLVGWNGGVLNNTYARGNVTGINYTGGLVGSQSGSQLNNTYAWGNVTGSYYTGGLVGSQSGGLLNNSYSVGKVNGNSNVGGLVGQKTSGNVTNCFWDSQTSSQPSSAGGTARTTAQMKARSTFANSGWDFNGTWCILENTTYPLLRWQDGGYPNARAGPNQTVDEGTLVALDGSGSSDDVDIVNYTWKFTDVNPVSLYMVKPTYLFKNLGVFLVSLFVRNAAGNTASDTTTVTVRDITRPAAEGGPDRTIERRRYNNRAKTSPEAATAPESVRERARQ